MKVLILLSVALLFAVALFVFGVGRFLYGIAHYYLRERKPEKFFRGELGVFTSEGDIWASEIRHGARKLRFLIGGTESAPNERLLAHAQHILERFDEVERRAIEFLRCREDEVRAATLDFCSIAFMDEQHPQDFTFEFTDPRDESRAWRVDFVAGEPKETGFDD